MHRFQFCSFSSALCSVVVVVAIAAGTFLVVPSGSASAVSPSLDGLAYPSELLAAGGKGLDKGTFELFQTGPDPSAWVWVEDATGDGVGTEYWIVHPSFVVPGPAEPSVDITYELVAQHPPIHDFADFLAFVIATYPNVTGPGDVQVYRKDAGPIVP